MQDKSSIMDLKAKSHSGKYFNIEIQVEDVGDYTKRALYYWARLYADQIGKGGNYEKLDKAIGIHILNFDLLPKLEPYHNVFEITDRGTKTRQFNDFELHTIELNKFLSKKNKDGLDEIVKKVQGALDMWCTFFTRSKLLKKDSLPAKLDCEELRTALEVLESMSLTSEERIMYNARLAWIRNKGAAFQKAFGDGKVEGEAKGRMEEKVEMAKKLLAKNNMSIEEISELTELPEHDIEELAYDMTNDKSAKRAKLTLG